MCRAFFQKFFNTISKRKQNVANATILEKDKKGELIYMQEELKKEEIQETKEEVNDAPKVEEPKEEVVEEKVEEKDQEKQEVPKEECADKEEVDEEAKVEEFQDEKPNGIRIEDLVTKADLQELLSAFNSKLDAIIKENQDLKEANSQMHDKYEVGDFGSEVKNGMMKTNAPKNYQSFEEYAKQFM